MDDAPFFPGKKSPRSCGNRHDKKRGDFLFMSLNLFFPTDISNSDYLYENEWSWRKEQKCMRIAGLASGMDIEQMVNDLMRAERMPMDKLIQQRQTLNWKMDEYRAINIKFNDFRNNIFDTVMRQANMLARTATSTDDSRVTAQASSAAGNATYRITEVQQLAQAESQVGGKIGEDFDPSKSLRSQNIEGSDLTWETGVLQRENIRVSENTKELTIDIPDRAGNVTNETDIIVKVNGQAIPSDGFNTTMEDGKMTLQFDEELSARDNVTIQYFTENETRTFPAREGTEEEEPEPVDTFHIGKGSIYYNPEDEQSIRVTVNGVALKIVTDPEAELAEDEAFVNLDTGLVRLGQATTEEVKITYSQEYTTSGITTYNENGEAIHDRFVIQSSQTLNQVINEINRSSVGVQAFFDEFENKMSFTRTETGVFNKDGAEIKFDGEFFNHVLQMADAEVQAAQNAKFTMNGLTTERHSNTFTIGGMTITLQDTFDESDNPVVLGSTVDTDGIFDTIKEFVDEYNELLETVHEKLKEERYRDYPPLTDEQRRELSEREAELWDEKAQSGLLRNDRTLSSIMDTLRLDLYGTVDHGLESEFNHLSNIGITTSDDYLERGKLEIDETKLREAIEADPEAVFQLFAADGETQAEQGVARRLRNSLDHAIDTLAERAGGFRGKIQNHQFTIGRNLNDLEDRITNFERRLAQIEDRYWRQFTAMEKAIARANEQSNFLYQQFMGQGGF